jgi:valyl-tRNA synthetase
MKIGRKLATKLLNVTKFVLSFADPGLSAADVVFEPLDRAMLTRLATVVEEATVSFEAFDYARALERTEAFFWWFCDDYVELVKSRAYGARGEAAARSALVALGTALNALQRLLAPIQPFVTDEVWSWWQSGSIHTSAWPTAAEVAPTVPADPAVLDAVGQVLAQVRRKKTEAKVSQRAAVERLNLVAPADFLAALASGEDDLRAAGGIAHLDLREGAQELAIEVHLAPPQA